MFSLEDPKIKSLLLPAESNYTVPDSTIDLFLQDLMKCQLREASMLAYLYERHIPNVKATLSKAQDSNVLMEKVVKAREIQLNAVRADLSKSETKKETMKTKYFAMERENKELKVEVEKKAALEERVKLLEEEKVDFAKSREAWRAQKEKFVIEWEKSLDDTYINVLRQVKA